MNIFRFLLKRSHKNQPNTTAATNSFEDLTIYMDPIEVSQLRAVIETLQPKNVLEWGCGGSTKTILESFPFIEKMVSVEHNKEWFQLVKNSIQDKRLTMFLDPPAIPEPDMQNDEETYWAWADLCEEDDTILTNYIQRPAQNGLKFDFILVDGRSRAHCIKQGWKILNPGGILMVHDAQRKHYHSPLHKLGRTVFLEPYKNGQICFVRKSL